MLQVSGLSHSYGKTQVLFDLDFTVQQGEILGFLGPNGAGKSTTMRILTGYLSPLSGRVLFDGQDIDKNPIALRKSLGYLPENVPCYPELTVSEFLDWAARIKLSPSPAKDVQEVVKRCGLTEVQGRLVKHLSKGYRQRTGLAQAILGPTRLLILDEPTVGLDPSQIREIRELIKELGRDKTILLSTHILPEVERTCDRVLIINKGRIIAEDTPANLMHGAMGANRFMLRLGGVDQDGAQVAQAFSDLAQVASAHVAAGESSGFEGLGSRQVVVHVEVKSGDARAELSGLAFASGWQVLEFKPADMTLEEAFVCLVRDENALDDEALDEAALAEDALAEDAFGAGKEGEDGS